jgi:CRISPR/Cas system-associated exonuclease Cas4 (RecB family)
MMQIGVPYDLYWFGDPFAVGYYVEAHELDLERKRDELDFTAWLQGAYVHEAVSASISQAMSKNSRAKYPKEPHTIVERRRRVQVKKEEAVTNAFAEFAGLASVYNARMKKQALRVGAEEVDPAS